MEYQDLILEAANYQRVKSLKNRTITQFTLRVLSSPAGEMTPEQAITVEYDELKLNAQLKLLEQRGLDRDGMIALGRTLGLLLMPPGQEGTGGPRELLAQSLLLVGPSGHLRLRLRLPPILAALPWEYIYLDRDGGEDMDGFVALDLRIAILRHEVMQKPAPPPLLTGDIKLVAALASPIDLDPLDLDTEKQVLEDALKNVLGIKVSLLENATLDQIHAALAGAGIFHFAGHGVAEREMGAQPGSYTLSGSIALEDQMVPAEQLGINLRGEGVRLAMLGGCETARQGGVYRWGAIAPTLAVKAEIPAVVAYQYSIKDTSAIAFIQGFYQALSGGLPVEYAVSKGRTAVYNTDPLGRDWGVPVLYLRAASGQLFQGAAEPAVREETRKGAEALVRMRIGNVAAGGLVTGADVTKMVAGRLGVDITVSGTVYGTVVGAKVDQFNGGKLDVGQDIDRVGSGGSVTAVKIDFFGDPNDPDD